MESVIGAFPSPLTSTDSLITGATSSCRVSRVDRGATCVTPGRQLGAFAQAAAGGTPQRPRKAPSPERGAAGCTACRAWGPSARATRGPPGGLQSTFGPGSPWGHSATPSGDRHGEAVGRNLGSRGCCSFTPLRFHFLPPDFFFFSLNEIPLPIWTQPPLLSWARWKGERRGGILNLLWRV